MDAEPLCAAVSRIAAAIAEPARTRILYSLMDGRARTSTELAAVADVSPATASVHLAKLKAQRLISMYAQGRHRYYSIEDPSVAAALESLSVLTGQTRAPFVSTAPAHLTAARTCYDHMAGKLAVAIHDRFRVFGWMRSLSTGEYDIEPAASEVRWALRSRPSAGCDGASRMPAWTGANASLTSVMHSEQHC